MENLWPDFDELPKGSTPGTILKEQAQALGEKFQNKIRGEVTSRRGGESFAYTFAVLCSPLGYRYMLFEAEYGLADLYPVKVTVDGDIAEELRGTRAETVIAVPDEGAFKQVLSQIFSAKKTMNLIVALPAP